MSEEEKTEAKKEKPEGEAKKKATPKAPAKPKRKNAWSGNAGNTPLRR